MIPWEAGRQIGPYLLAGPIGSGGMGEVWKKRDTRLDRIVAIKRLKRQHTARFEQEARAIAALNHAHICQIYDIGPNYLVMQYIEGRSPEGPLPEDAALKPAAQIADALTGAHSRAILHRDLKPANILVTAKGAAKLLDFGIAKLTADSDATQTMAGSVTGTPLYMSPEQAEGKALDARSDIFSLGAVLRDEPGPLKAPDEIARIVMRCLRKAPADRFQSMDEVKAALERVSATPPDQQPSIAVLPFANMSRDADDEYFSDESAEAYQVRASLRMNYEWNWRAGGEDLARAIELNPALAEAHVSRSLYMISQRRNQEALAAIRSALELDPVNIFSRTTELFVLRITGAGALAVERARALVDLFGGFSLVFAAAAFDRQGLYEEAATAIQKFLELSPGNMPALANLASVRGHQGRPAEAEVIRADLERFYQLPDQALDERELAVPVILMDLRPEFQSDPRYQALLRRINLEKHQK